MGPSGANGVSGMRPTYGRVSRRGVMALAWSLDKAGPIARSAQDLGLVLQVIAGPDALDRTSGRNSAFEFWREPGPIEGKKIGVVRAEFEGNTPAANQIVFTRALAVLRDAGYVLEEVVLPDYPYGQVYSVTSQTEAGANFKHLYDDKRIAGFWSADRRADWMAATLMPASDYIRAQRIRGLIKRDADAITSQYTAIVAPTGPTGSGPINPPARSATPAPAAPEAAERGAERKLNTMGNLAGLPSVSVPCGFDADGMPLGLHIAARSWDDQSALDVAMVFQNLTGFHRMRPAFRA